MMTFTGRHDARNSLSIPICIVLISISMWFLAFPFSEARAAQQVGQPFILVSGGGKTTSFTVSGCNVSPTTVVGNGLVQQVNADPNCQLTLTVPADGVDTRYRFTPLSPTLPITTCISGTCNTVIRSYYLQTLTTFTVTANAQAAFDAGLTFTVSGTFLGSSAFTLCTLTTAAIDFSKTCQVYADYNTAVSLPATPTGAPTNSRWMFSSPRTFKDTIGGDFHTVKYYKQYSDSFLYRVVGGGTSSAPTLSYDYLGSQVVSNLDVVPTLFWFDAGAEWSSTASLGGSSNQERWSTASSSGIISSSKNTITLVYYNQYAMNASYAVSEGNPRPPLLNSTQFGLPFSVPFSTTVGVYWLDTGAKWDLPAALNESTATDRWITLGQTSGTMSASVSLSLAYFHQYLETVSYAVIGGGSPSTPTLDFVVLGAPQQTPVNGSARAIWIDAGSLYSITNPLGGSTINEGWFTQKATGTISAAGNFMRAYYHQYLVIGQYSVADGGTPTAPTFSTTSFGVAFSQALTASAQSIWVDIGSIYDLTNPLGESSANQRWFTSDATNGFVSSPLTVFPVYYRQFIVSPMYDVIGGGTPTAPTFVSTSLGTTISSVLTSTPQTLWLDAVSAYSATDPLQGSTPDERWWATNAEGTIVDSISLNITFYRQIPVSLSYSVMGGGGPLPPDLAYSFSGTETFATLTNSSVVYWLDYGTTWSALNPLAGSSPSERWQSALSSESPSQSTNVSLSYYHQVLISTNYTIIGGGGPKPPFLKSTRFGTQIEVPVNTIPQGVWLDSGSAYSITNPLTATGHAERWMAERNVNGTISFSSGFYLLYVHQFRVNLILSPPQGGLVLDASGWYNIGTTQIINAFPKPEWKFGGWNGTGVGSYTGLNSNSSILVEAPVNETAYFYPGLTISAIGRGAVTYTYASVTGSVPESTTKIIFVKPGTNVTLSAVASSYVDGFTEWRGGASGRRPATTVVVNQPVTIDSVFGINLNFVGLLWASIGVYLILGMVVAGVSSTLYRLMRGRSG